MKFFRLISAIFFWGVIQTSLYAQTTTTLGGLTTVTSGQINGTSLFHVNVSGTDYVTTPGNLAKLVLGNITLSPGLGTTGSSLTFGGVTSVTLGTGLTGVSGVGAITLSNNGVLSLSIPANSIFASATMLTGTATLVATTNGVITLSGITATGGTINTLASTTGSITTGTIGSLFSTTGSITLSSLIVSSTGSAATTNIPLQAVTTSPTGVYSATIGGLGIGRSSTGVHFISATTGSGFTTGTASPYGISFESGGLGVYVRVPSTRSFDWNIDSTNVAGITSNGFYSTAFTTDLRGSGLRLSTSAAAASGTITTSNVVETLSGGITRTLSITGQTGRIYWCYNTGATTSTLHGGGANINNASTQGIMTGSSALLFSDGTNAWGIIK